jgi:hypothetical protein
MRSSAVTTPTTRRPARSTHRRRRHGEVGHEQGDLLQSLVDVQVGRHVLLDEVAERRSEALRSRSTTETDANLANP